MWHGDIEKVQRACAIIILGKLATTEYFCNLTLLNLEPLVDRREQLCTKFAKKTVKHPVHRNMFKINPHNNKVVVPVARTARYEKSTVPSLARIINSLWSLSLFPLSPSVYICSICSSYHIMPPCIYCLSKLLKQEWQQGRNQHQHKRLCQTCLCYYLLLLMSNWMC